MTPKLMENGLSADKEVTYRAQNLHHRRGNGQQANAQQKSATRVVFLVEGLRSAAASPGAPTAAKAEPDKRHHERREDGHHRDDDDQPVLLEQLVVLVLLYVGAEPDLHVADDEISCKGTQR